MEENLNSWFKLTIKKKSDIICISLKYFFGLPFLKSDEWRILLHIFILLTSNYITTIKINIFNIGTDSHNLLLTIL